MADIGLGSFVMAGGAVHLVLLAGVEFRTSLLPHLRSWASSASVPLEHLGIGQHKAWLLANTPHPARSGRAADPARASQAALTRSCEQAIVAARPSWYKSGTVTQPPVI